MVTGLESPIEFSKPKLLLQEPRLATARQPSARVCAEAVVHPEHRLKSGQLTACTVEHAVYVYTSSGPHVTATRTAMTSAVMMSKSPAALFCGLATGLQVVDACAQPQAPHTPQACASEPFDRKMRQQRRRSLPSLACRLPKLLLVASLCAYTKNGSKKKRLRDLATPPDN